MEGVGGDNIRSDQEVTVTRTNDLVLKQVEPGICQDLNENDFNVNCS